MDVRKHIFGSGWGLAGQRRANGCLEHLLGGFSGQQTGHAGPLVLAVLHDGRLEDFILTVLPALLKNVNQAVTVLGNRCGPGTQSEKQTEWGRGLFPKTCPNQRRSTANKQEANLLFHFYIIV